MKLTFYMIYMFYMVKFQLRAEGHSAILIDVVRVAFEACEVVVAHGLSEVDETQGIPEMLFAFLAETVLAAGGKRVLDRINRIYVIFRFL